MDCASMVERMVEIREKCALGGMEEVMVLIMS